MITKLKCIYHILKGDGVVYRLNLFWKGEIETSPKYPAKHLYECESNFDTFRRG